MQYRQVGDSGPELSVISFGAWAAGGWMWGGNEPKDAIDAIRASYDLGVTSIDTAPAYGQGLSEEIVGRAIRDLPRNKVQVLTKYGLRWDLAKGEFHFKSQDNAGRDIDLYKYAARESIFRECEDSLRRLATDYIDLYQIHWPDNSTPIEETMSAVAELIRQGKVRYAGVCNYSAPQLEEARRYVNLVSNQVPYSMVNRGIEAEVVPYCLENGLSILAYSPIQRGLLSGKIKPGHQIAAGDHRAGLYYFREENIRRTNAFLDSIKGIAESKNASLAQVVLKWTISQPGITVALAGARNAEQAVQNAKAADIELSHEELEFISTHLNALQLTK